MRIDVLVLAGENPIMPTPPNVWLDEPKADVLFELLEPEALAVPEAPLVPATVEVPELPGVLPDPKIELPPKADPPVEDEPNEEPPMPLVPLGPVPAITAPPAEPAPAIGWPKKPVDCVLASPKRIGFQSSLLVVGSMYFLRRKWMSLVLTSAFALGG